MALTASSPAAATVVNVRIEGRSTTLFEGPVQTTGRNVQAVSERATGTIHHCDGTNNGANPGRVATPTASAVDAMSIVGQGFEGRWNANIEDYFVRGFGPDLETGPAYWGVLVGDNLTSVGGCQTALGENAEVLWAYDAFSGRPFLGLAGPGTATPGVAQGFQVTQSGGSPKPIAEAGLTSSPAATITGGSGSFSVTFPGDGWYRLKADGARFIRSNRIYVCVGACGPAPADAQVRVPPAPVFYGPGGAVLRDSPALAGTTAKVRITRPAAGTSGYRRGRIVVRWRVAEQGVGLLRWAVASDDLTSRSKRYVTRARGTSATSASLRLPAGRVHALRFTSTDRMLRQDTIDFGRVIVPVDERAKSVRRTGPWRKLRSGKAWKGTLLRGRPGARIRVKLAAGRPALLVRGRRAAVVRIGAKSVRVRPGRRTVLGSKRRRAGTVTVSVTRGSIDLDGIAASP
ncbi:MAG TPA: hypothetical protein VFY44_06260 [Thermoleophilaceae bacterium]|nr:hypothetical protein [Thermoleophilaceae bacterium]